MIRRWLHTWRHRRRQADQSPFTEQTITLDELRRAKEQPATPDLVTPRDRWGSSRTGRPS